MARSNQKRQGLDWLTLALYLSLMFLGWILIYATNYTDGDQIQDLSWRSESGKQLIWIGVSLVAFVCVSVIDWKVWEVFAYPLFFGSLIVLLAVLIFGTEIKGARSWFVFGAVSFQPSELAKLATAFALSAYLASFKSDLRSPQSFLFSLGIITIPALLILMQPDAGSALVFGSFFILLYRRGLSPIYFLIGFALIASFIASYKFGLMPAFAVILLLSLFVLFYQMDQRKYWLMAFGPIAVSAFIAYDSGFQFQTVVGLAILNLLFVAILIFNKKAQSGFLMGGVLLFLVTFSYATSYLVQNVLKPHQRDRINVWLKPEECDPQGSLYNLIQSKTAISSGGVYGKGFLNGAMTKLNYVPEQSTDFIFSTLGEEHGFVGVLTVILLFMGLVFQILKIGERASNKFITNFCYAIAGILFLHFFLNIGMTMGLTPVIGIPLPFLSKGGSSLLVFSIMIGIILRMDLARLRI